MVRSRQAPGEDDVAVQEAADSVGHRLVHIVALHQNRVKAGDGTPLAVAGPLHQLRQGGKNRGGVTPGCRRLPYGQAHLPLGDGEPGQGVHHQEDVFPLVAEVLGNGRGRKSALNPHQGRLVGGGDYYDGAGQAFRSQVAFDKVPHLPAALADEGDDVDVSGAVAGDHPQEGALTNAAAGKDADPLAAAAGQEGVDGFDPRSQDFLDPAPGQGVGRPVVDRLGVAAHQDGAVQGPAQAVQDAAQQFLPHPDVMAAAGGYDPAAGANALQLPQGHEEGHFFPEADHLGDDGAGAVVIDPAEFADSRLQPPGFDGQARYPGDLAAPAPEGGAGQALAVRCQVGSQAHGRPPPRRIFFTSSSWVSTLASIKPFSVSMRQPPVLNPGSATTCSRASGAASARSSSRCWRMIAAASGEA
ncbi:O-acetylhomoserine sulfhydrylase [Moorella thermoacetica Y72]|uniref:O-acetylhomoserine sulfhydrylase n=1 Tax=Moorella thermoacetica Y72 TaxID=1325331 RepID=A0A0S6UCN1_NEOTH|nr:O-acetylhomoserine sulfhydrylase [Moorella thermoacetica Y72]